MTCGQMSRASQVAACAFGAQPSSAVKSTRRSARFRRSVGWGYTPFGHSMVDTRCAPNLRASVSLTNTRESGGWGNLCSRRATLLASARTSQLAGMRCVEA
jgi:hypothetical protein